MINAQVCFVWSNVGPLIFNGCVKLLDNGTHVIHIDPEHPKDVQWVTCLVSMQNWVVFSFQELCPDH